MVGHQAADLVEPVEDDADAAVTGTFIGRADHQEPTALLYEMISGRRLFDGETS